MTQLTKVKQKATARVHSGR